MHGESLKLSKTARQVRILCVKLGKSVQNGPPKARVGGKETSGVLVKHTFGSKSRCFAYTKPHFAKTRVCAGPELVTKVTSEFAEACFSKRNMNMLMYM